MYDQYGFVVAREDRGRPVAGERDGARRVVDEELARLGLAGRLASAVVHVAADIGHRPCHGYTVDLVRTVGRRADVRERHVPVVAGAERAVARESGQVRPVDRQVALVGAVGGRRDRPGLAELGMTRAIHRRVVPGHERQVGGEWPWDAAGGDRQVDDRLVHLGLRDDDERAERVLAGVGRRHDERPVVARVAADEDRSMGAEPWAPWLKVTMHDAPAVTPTTTGWTVTSSPTRRSSPGP
jgi:hypothetical protein